MPFVLLQLSLLIHLAFYGLAPERTASRAFMGVAVVIMAFVGVSLTFALSAHLRSYVRVIYERWPMLRWLTTIGMLIAVGVLGFLMRPEWFYVHGLVTVCITFAVAYRMFIESKLTLRWNLLLIGLSIFALAFRLVFLQLSPPINPIDEGWTFGWAYSAYRTGQLSDQIMLGWHPGYQVIPLYFLLMGAWFHLLEPSFGSARLFSFLISILTLVFTARAAQVWYGQRVGGWAAFALLSSAIFLTALTTRHDVGLSFFVALCLWLYSEALHRQKAWLHFAAGAAIGAGLLSHYHAALLGVAFTIGFYAPSFILSVWRTRRPVWDGLWFGIGGGLVGLVIFAIQAQGAGTLGLIALLTTSNLPLNILTSFSLLARQSLFEASIITLAAAFTLWRGTSRDVVLVLTLILAQIGLAVQQFPAAHYLVPLVPLYALLILGLLNTPNEKQFVQTISPPFITACLLMGAFAYTLRTPVETLLKTRLLSPTPAAVEWVNRHVSPDAIIIGDHEYLIWLHDYSYGSPLIAHYLVRDGADVSAVNVWDALKPDVFLIDRQSIQYFLYEPLLDTGYLRERGYSLAAELDTLMVYARPSALLAGSP